MKFSLILILAFAGSLTFANGAKNLTPITPVENFELVRYLGEWYEIGSVPQHFSKGCTCSKAKYSPRQDGRIDVLNECRLNGPAGELKTASGVGRFASDNKSVGYLEVNFTGVPFFWADYVIVDLDPWYNFAAVTDFKGETLWILSREPQLPLATLRGILERVEKAGVKTAKFELTRQADCWN